MIRGLRIINLDRYVGHLINDDRFYVVKTFNDADRELLQQAGFINMAIGETILPAIVGPRTRYNVNGSFIIRRDLPKETCFREGCCKDWGGNWHYFTVPYQRYPRIPIPAPEIEISIAEQEDIRFVTSPIMSLGIDGAEKVKHVINMFLELFGECEIVQEGHVPAFGAIEISHVNWELLPPGEYPWERFPARELISTRQVKSRAQRHTYSTITAHHPEQIVKGRAGFRGYLAYIFPDKNIALLEHVFDGNATYVFTSDWERWAQLTKSEVINGHHMLRRIEHRDGWEDEINTLLR